MRTIGTAVAALLCAGAVAFGAGVKVQVAGQARQAPKPDPLAVAEDDDPATRKVKELLKTKTVSFEFQDTAFTDAVSFIRAVLDVNIVVSPEIAKGDQKLTLTVRDMKAGAALQWLLQLGGARMKVQDGAIYVEPDPDRKQTTPRVHHFRVYPQARHYRRMIGKTTVQIGDIGTVELYLYEDDLPAESREQLLKMLKGALKAELEKLAADEPQPKK
jgi:hypothetical protein